ncbi:MAG: translation initiation factor IF-2 [Crocinitomicaceae bacterium]|nr:translation initiation factor IF-2 [Crocinitomicaceae bacterium]
MADANKPVRLNKIAREFNLGIQTIVDFLASKGMEVDAKPNTKIDAEAYALIRSNFQDEKAAKEKAVSSANRAVIDRESVTLASARKTAAPQEEAEMEIDLSVFQKSQQQPEVERIKPEATAEPAPVVEQKVAAEVPKEPASDVTSPVKVLGKVDLDAMARKPKAKTKAEKEANKEKLAKKSAEIAKKEAAAQAAKKAEAEKAAAAEKAVKPEVPKVEKLETKIEKLSGPTVVGKIELPVEKKKTPAAKSEENKRKRKRITKVDVERQARTAGGQRGDRGRGRRNEPKKEVSQADIQKEIKETLARLSGGKKSNAAKMRRAKRSAVAERAEQELQRQQEEAMTLQLTEFVTVAELASMMNANVNEVISACMTLGIMVSINQRLDSETITIIAEEFGYEANFVSAEVQEAIEVEEDNDDDLSARPPIVTVMGHVDHGKTSLLDFIRNANVIAGEAGGITQHIGAYHVTLPQGGQMTFLDTPGHEAFTAMRARGAQVTDIAIIVVAADDAVMPQTKEAINHAQAAGIPMVIAINKMDRPEANADKIRQELAEMSVQVEEWGGKFQSQEISAKNGTNIEELLEKVLLEAEMLDLQANPGKRAIGTVVESSLDKGRGYVTNLLVEGGTMRIGDAVLAGQFSGKVKAMFNERGARVDEAGPSVPVSILGFDGAPSAGDKFHVFDDEREARNIAVKRQQLQREQGVRSQRAVTLEELGRRIAVGEFKELNLIVKGDVDGSIEALSDSLEKLSTEKVQVNIIHKAVGQVSESDILLASASSAILIGFQVRPSGAARRLAEKEGVQIKLYSVIYKAIEEMKDAMEGLLSVKIEENVVGSAEIRETFKISKVGTIAGCFVIDGNIKRNNKVRVIREGVVVYTGTLGSLKRFKDDVKEVAKGFECGLNIDRFNDIKVGDVVEAYEEVEVKQTLED